MKAALALLPLLLVGATDENQSEPAEAHEAFRLESVPHASAEPVSDMPNAGALDQARCAERIREVRRDRGLPELRREPAEPADAVLWSAVDRRIEGCTVLVRHGDPDDVRPFPEVRDGRLFRRVPVGDE